MMLLDGACPAISSPLDSLDEGFIFLGVGGEALTTAAGVSSVLRDLAGTVIEVVETLDRHPSQGLDAASPALLHEPVPVGLLNHLLERVVEPVPPPSSPVPAPLTGLTLQAVSRRTGIPAATLRTWERRYGLVRPPRLASAYRSHGQEDLRAILHVKHLREQSVRIGQAMATVARDR